MNLNAENYHSVEANKEFFSVSSYKDFVGTYAMRGCEAFAIAKMKGEWKEEKSIALMVGSYVDASFEGTLDVFKAQNPEIFTKAGELKSEYRQANDIIARVERDPYWMKYLSGEKQKIFTGELFGVKWKIKLDSYIENVCLVDLKVMREDLRRSYWVKDLGHHVSWVQYWGYDVQAAVYQKIVQLNTGKLLPFYLAVTTKEKHPDHEIIGFTDKELVDTLSTVVTNVNRIKDLKDGVVQPDRCECCDFCKATKVITRPVHFSELVLSI